MISFFLAQPVQLFALPPYSTINRAPVTVSQPETGHSHESFWDIKLADYQELCLHLREQAEFLQAGLSGRGKTAIIGSHLHLFRQSLDRFAWQSRGLLELLQDRPFSPGLMNHDSVVAVRRLSARVVFTEEFAAVWRLISSDKALRRMVRGKVRVDDSVPLAELPAIARQVLSRNNQRQLGTSLENFSLWLQTDPDRMALLFGASPDSVYRRLLKSELWSRCKHGRAFGDLFQRRFYWSDLGRDLSEWINRIVLRGLRLLVSGISWRDGYLYQHQEVGVEIETRLRPLDILLRRRNSGFITLFTPGYWVHAAVWLGDQASLLEMGLWDHPSIQPFHEQIKQGRSVYEMRYNGVNYVTLEEFLDLDQVAITRVEGMFAEGSAARVYRNLVELKDRQYDFSFELMRTERVVCTDIVFLAFDRINWPRSHILGQTVILPDDLARLVLYRNSPLRLVSFYAAWRPGQGGEYRQEQFAELLGYRQTSRPLNPDSGLARLGRESRILSWLDYGTAWFQLRHRVRPLHYVYQKIEPEVPAFAVDGQ